MPKPKDTPGVEIDQYQKEKEEFADAMDEVFSEENVGKTNDEIADAMAKKDAKTQDAGGEPTKDLEDDGTVKPAADDSDVLIPGQGVVKDEKKPTDDVPATVDKTETLTDVDGLQKRVVALEEELTKERQKTSSWNGRITAANKRVTDMEAELVIAKQKQAPSAEDAAAAAAKATTKSDNEVLEGFRKDFPELSSVVDIMQKRIDGVVSTPAKAAAAAPTPEHVGDERIADDVLDEHATSIRKVHPDLSEMVNTGVLLTWINKQPDFIRPTLETIYTSGTSEQVVNMVTEFKDKTGWKSQLTKADDKTTAAKDKLNSMKEVNSETGTPNGKTVDKNDFDQGAKDAGF